MTVDKLKLQSLVADTDSLIAYLSGLSNAQMRIAQKTLSEDILPLLASDDEYWMVFIALYRSNSKMWLVVLLKSLGRRIADGRTRVSELIEFVGGLSGNFTDIDRQKFLACMLPLLENPEDAKLLLRATGLGESADWIGHLLAIRTKAAGFLLLEALRYVEHDRSLLFRTCRYLMKRGDTLGFSLASIIRLSYDIKEVRGTFSLHLAPYELSRIEQNYDAFCKVVRL